MANVLTGSKPGKGNFRVNRDNADWLIFIVRPNGERIERACSVWQSTDCKGLSRVYEILREYGFTMAGK